ncbi:hypothetical protein KTR66_10190 [Roseococcus sp. SDR]|uniref:hypothetical protein n=1 Tax=Roseococcus sp. SDR TaxID=2835532 RepID=UPI001BCF16BC|nr:hypothetical protein [Roseococcus sp. SDR]MBS7790368.1 hypothetical protein [Roseococcus sp. SDR]MBV1845682.1 hypothetical protein [Roseococcus sp. SDR]
MSMLAELHRRQPDFARAGWVALAWLLACLVLAALDPRLFDGVSVWVKPAKFAASFVAWFWTLAWFWPALSPAQQAGRLAHAVVLMMLAMALFEQGWITWRAAWGAPSHFARDGMGAVVYALMGLGATLLVAGAALLGLMILWRGNPAVPRPSRLAAGLGLLLTGVLGGVTGFAIGGQGSAWVAGGSNAAGWPPFYWNFTAGDLRVAHFLAIHAMQAIPLAVWLWPRAMVAWGAAAGWAGMTWGALLLARAA